MKKKKVLILGASSFSGASMVDFLLSKKKYSIYGTHRRKKNISYLPYLKNKNIKNFRSYKVDFRNNSKDLIKIILSIKPAYIIDFASICMVNQSWNYPQTYFNTNVLYKADIYKNLSKYNFLKKYIYISTPEIFGSSSKSIKENYLKFNPSTPYATSKLSSELLLKNYEKNFNAPIVITRFSNFFGPGQPIYRLIPKVIISIDKKIKFPLEGNGGAKRNYIFSQDFCNGLYKVMLKGRKGAIYHIAGNKYFKTIDIIKMICALKSYDYKKLIKKTNKRLGQDQTYKLDSKKTRRELNWKPIYSIKKALTEVINYSKKELNNILRQNLIYTDSAFK